MAEFAGGNEEYISAREPIVFENKTESQYEVCAGIVFHKSGIYEVSVVGNKTIVSEVSKRKTGKWIRGEAYPHRIYCSECYKTFIPNDEMRAWVDGDLPRKYCPECGARMEVSNDT